MKELLGNDFLEGEGILFYVDHTSRFQRNTGIQRCVRCLARAFQELGVLIQPVVWNRKLCCLEPATKDHRFHLAKWNGPNPGQWVDGETPLSNELINARWLIVAELVSGPYNPRSDEFLRVSMRHGLSVAWLFHDAIPLQDTVERLAADCALPLPD